MQVNNQQADQELFGNFNIWTQANPAKDISNSPSACNQISQDTANNLRNKWNPNSKPNTWDQSSSTAYIDKSNIKRWVSRSVSGGPGVVDFHALWQGYKFLWHFEIV